MTAVYETARLTLVATIFFIVPSPDTGLPTAYDPVMPRLDQIHTMLQKEPADVFLNFALAMEYVKADRLEEAVTQFKQVATLDPNYTAAYFQQGNALITLGRLHDASATLRQGIEVANRIGDQHAAGEMGEVLATLG